MPGAVFFVEHPGACICLRPLLLHCLKVFSLHLRSRQNENSYLSGVIWLCPPAGLYYNPESMNIPTLRRRTAVVAYLLFAAFSLSAQNTQYFIEDVSADVDGEVAVNVRGISIDTLVGVQFSVSWDTLLLQFVRVENVALDGAQNQNFNQSQVNEGRLGYLEQDGSLQGFGLPDSALLFTIVFDPLTTVTSETEITFTDMPLPARVKSTANNDVEPDLIGGMVTLNGANSLHTFAEDPRLTVAPNPFRDYGQLTLQLPYGGTATLEILDMAGRRLAARDRDFTPGATRFELTGQDFPANGTYILRLTTGREQLHRKVVVQGR